MAAHTQLVHCRGLFETQPSTLAEAAALSNAAAPEAAPYDKKYEARALLQAQCEAVEGALAAPETPELLKPLLRVLVGELDCRLGEVAMDVEEPHVAELCLGRALEALAPGSAAVDDAEIVAESEDARADLAARCAARLADAAAAAAGDGYAPAPAVAPRLRESATRCLNAAAILWHQRDQPRRALRLLRIAEAGAGVESDGCAEADTKTLFFLAQVHAALGEGGASAAYCARTLCRQISEDASAPGGVRFEVAEVEWARNCVGLAKYFCETGSHGDACACGRAALAAASLAAAGDDDDRERLLTLRADAHKVWGQIHLAFLETPAAGRAANAGGLDFCGLSDPARTPQLSYGLPAAEHGAPVVYDDVRRLHVAASRAFRKAGRRYVLDGFVSEHVDLALLTSRLHKHAQQADRSHARRQALRQRRVALLDPLREALTADAYRDLRATLAFEVGQVLMALVDAKADRLGRYKDPAALRGKRELCDFYARKAVAVYDDFKRVAGGVRGSEKATTVVEKLADEDVEAYLLSSFYAARLAGKTFHHEDDAATLGRCRDSLARYRAVVADVAEAREKKRIPATFFVEEGKLCADMIALLPSKLELAAQGKAFAP